MSTNNAINLSQPGIASYDGLGNFFGRSLVAGANITITNPDGIAGNPTIAATVMSMPFNSVTTTTQAMSSNNGYAANNAAQVVFTLPASPAFGDRLIVDGQGLGGWKIGQNAGQQINFGILATTAGTGGSLASTKQFDCVALRCIVAGASAVWVVENSVGNITVV